MASMTTLLDWFLDLLKDLIPQHAHGLTPSQSDGNDQRPSSEMAVV